MSGVKIEISEESFVEISDYYTSFLSPVCLLYFLHLVDFMNKNNASKVIFLSREGLFLSRAFNVFSRSLGLNVRSQNMITSRSFLYKLLVDNDAILFKLSESFKGTVSEYFTNKLSTSRYSLLDSGFSDDLLDSFLDLPGDCPTLSNVVKKYAHGSKHQLRIKASEYMRYFQSVAGNGDNCIFADVGYSGTIQKLFSLFCGKAFKGFYIITTSYCDSCPLTRDNIIRGLFHKVSVFGSGNPIVDNSLLLEIMMSAPYGQLNDIIYTPCSQDFNFIFGEDTYSQIAHCIFAHGQQAVYDFIERFSLYFKCNYSNDLFVGHIVDNFIRNISQPCLAPALLQSLGYVDDKMLSSSTYTPWKRLFRNKYTESAS